MIFSRLYIQSCIDLIRGKNRNIKQLLIMLNSDDKQALEAMWEIVISAELSKLGYLELEKDFSEYGVTSKPDLFFRNKDLEFIADIKCISDHNKHDNNRVGELQSLIYQHLSNLGLNNFSCYIDIEDIVTQNRNGKSIDLKLPKDIAGVFHKSIKNKLNLDQRTYHFANLDGYIGLCFCLEIRLNDKFSIAHHTSYTASEDDRNTTLYKTLSTHYKQIEFYNGFKGFIVCDGDYRLFKQNNYGRKRYATFESTCQSYFKQRNKVGFIVGIWIDNKKGIYERGYNVKYQIYCSNLLKKQKIEKLFEKIVESLPEVVRSPVNVKNLLSSKNKYGNGSIGFKGSSSKTESIYGFSLREIQRILAGHQVLMTDEKHNMFPYLISQKLVRIWLDQDVYKEDYYFNFKCVEDSNNIEKFEEVIDDYDILISIRSFMNLMLGKIEFNAFEEEFILNNKLQINLFKHNYDNGYLIKNVGLIEPNKIGFKFDAIKSPLISDFS